jgi:hypothetical protein
MVFCLFFLFGFILQKELSMKKLTSMLIALVMVCGVLGGCYSKSCDVSCPSVKESKGS